MTVSRSLGVVCIAVAVVAAVGLWLALLECSPRSRRLAEPAEENEASSGERAVLLEPVAVPDTRVEEGGRTTAEGTEKRERASADSSMLAPFRGVVLDVATGEPVGYLHLAAGVLEAEVGPDGSFACDRPLAAEVRSIEFDDPFLGARVCTLERDELELEPGAERRWIARIPIGPTYRFVVPEGAPPNLEGWKGRVTEVDLRGKLEFDLDTTAVRTSDYVLIHPGDPPFLRFAEPWTPNKPGDGFLIEVLGTCEYAWGGMLDSAVGVYRELVPLSILERHPVLRGRVVNPEGEGVSHARVKLVALDQPGKTWSDTITEQDGSFGSNMLESGPYRLFARSRPGETPRTRRIDVQPCVNELEDLVIQPRPGVGKIQGRLVYGSDAEPDPFDRPYLWLRALDGSFEQVAAPKPGHEGKLLPSGKIVYGRGEPGEQIFEFDDVPAGLFELSVVSSDLVPWNPVTVRVAAPAPDVVFLHRDDLPRRKLLFTVLDDETGSRIDSFFVYLGSGEQEGMSSPSSLVPRDVPVQWVVSAQGYRPFRGSERDLQETEAGLEATVRLVHGWGVRFVLRANDIGLDHRFSFDSWILARGRPPVVGAAILADGQVIGRTDRYGEAFIDLDRPPKHMELRAPGWRVMDPFLEQPSDDYRQYLVWLIAE